MSWELVAALVVAVWLLGLGLLVALMRAAARGDTMLDAEARRAEESKVKESEAEDVDTGGSERKAESPPRERWTISPRAKDDPPPRHMPDRDRVERRRMPR
jgi:hypothetical protein